MTCKRFTAAEYAFYASGTLSGPEKDELHDHLRSRCQSCIEEVKDAVQFWFIFAALAERTQAFECPEPTPMLRERVLGLVKPGAASRRVIPVRTTAWLRMAAGIALAVGAASASWTVGRWQMKREVLSAQNRIDQGKAAYTKLEAEADALRNLVVAARNAPAVFPGRESIVSVQDPYLVRDLQRAKQTQVAASQALIAERAKASDLETRLSQTTSLLAAATRDKEDADRQYRKASDASLERERGITKLSQEIDSYKNKVQRWETELTKSRVTIASQNKTIEQRSLLMALIQSRNATLIPLHGTDAAKKASGVIVIGDNSRIAFLPADLPATALGRTYQLWMVANKGSQVVSLGTFNVTKDTPALLFADRPVASVQALTVTEEPFGGSQLPTGNKLLIGTPKGL